MPEFEQNKAFQHIPLQIRVELMCPPLALDHVMALEPGVTLVTDRAAGDNMDLRIGGQLVVRAEMVVTDRGFGFRITQLGDRA
jgi:flagellar motor switch/type III secretory pathway protein FliN